MVPLAELALLSWLMNRGMKAMLGHYARWFRAGSSHWQFLVLMSSLSLVRLNTKYLRPYLWPPNWDRRSEWWAFWGAFGGGSGSISRGKAAHCANSDITSICGSLDSCPCEVIVARSFRFVSRLWSYCVFRPFVTGSHWLNRAGWIVELLRRMFCLLDVCL